MGQPTDCERNPASGCGRRFRADGKSYGMTTFFRRLAPVAITCAAIFLGAATVAHSNARPRNAAGGTNGETAPGEVQALRLNTLGVAYMNQQRPADAQKLFEKALAADPTFAVAKVNLGIALLAQQKPEQARTELAAGAEKRPDDPYAWYNLGLALKDLSEQEKGVAAFQHVTQIAPNEADAYYFEGY